jgi:hypothetical protein
MSNTRTVRTLAEPQEAIPGQTTTLVRGDPLPGQTTTLVRGDPPPGEGSELHPALRAQLRELELRSGSDSPDLGMLLKLINDHYYTAERERRGIV